MSEMLSVRFFLSIQPKHKIQSNAPLQLHMLQSPKMMAPLVKEWIPQAFTVSFKVKKLYKKLFLYSVVLFPLFV